MELRWLIVLVVVLSMAYAGRKKERGLKVRHREGRDEPEEGFCELEINCKGDVVPNDTNGLAIPVKLPIRGPRGPQGHAGEPGLPGENGMPGLPGLPGPSFSRRRGLNAPVMKKVAFFVGLSDNMGPVTEHTDILFDRVITNVGGGYDSNTGKFTAPANATYQFNVIVSAQGRQKAAVMILKNGAMIATVWAESIPYWATASNVAILSLEKGDQVWLVLLSRASYLHGYMYTTFSGFIVFEN